MTHCRTSYKRLRLQTTYMSKFIEGCSDHPRQFRGSSLSRSTNMQYKDDYMMTCCGLII